MNKIQKFNILLIVIFLIAALGYGFSLVSLVSAIASSDLTERRVCLKSECIKRFSDTAEGALSVGKATSDLLVAVATAGGILVALWNYFSVVENSALANHISHFSTFQTYLNNEISKRSRIHAGSIDTFHWYNMIFPNSKSGSMIVADGYKGFVGDLNAKISNSNFLASTPTGESFRYKPHQVAMKSQLEKIGILIPLQPRVEYYEIEDQLFSLISCVNNAFCVGGNVEMLTERKYA